jgi:membrane-bound metal-dependent hydrolase YbcI (DUF457 family)
MDVLSHALWGYAVLRWRGPRTARWGALSGAAPDLLFYVPGLLRQIYVRGLGALTSPGGRDPSVWHKDGPPLPADLVDTYDHYYVLTHSLVILSVLGLVWWLLRRRSVWVLVPCWLHILMDIPTHERFLTPMFFPVSGFTVMGYAWNRPPVLIANAAALLATYAFLFWRYWRPGRPPRTAPWPEDARTA